MTLGASTVLTHAGANSLTIDGSTVSLGSFTLTDNAATAATTGTISAAIGGLGGLVKTGDGSLTLPNANGYQGGTTVNAGTLLVNNGSGSGTGSGAVAVTGTGTLGGTGTISGTVNVTPSGSVAPGSPISGTAVFRTGSVSFQSGTTFAVQVNGDLPGTTHDQLRVTGAVVLNDATLALGGVVPAAPGSDIVLIDNDGRAMRW